MCFPIKTVQHSEIIADDYANENIEPRPNQSLKLPVQEMRKEILLQDGDSHQFYTDTDCPTFKCLHPDPVVTEFNGNHPAIALQSSPSDIISTRQGLDLEKARELKASK